MIQVTKDSKSVIIKGDGFLYELFPSGNDALTCVGHLESSRIRTRCEQAAQKIKEIDLLTKI